MDARRRAVKNVVEKVFASTEDTANTVKIAKGTVFVNTKSIEKGA
jgi:hypothetical protein